MNKSKFSFPKAAPESLLAAIFLAFLGTAGVFYVNMLAALVSGLIVGLNYSSEVAGYVAAVNVYGAAVGAFLSIFAVKKLPWRRVALVSLIMLMVIDLLSTQITASDVLIPTRFVHGTFGGFMVGIALSVIARTKSPSRTFGMLLVVQAGIGGLALMVIPKLVPTYGTPILFLSLFCFSAVTLLMLPFIADYPPRDHALQKTSPKGKILVRPLALALVGVFIFQASNMGLAAFMIELGKSYGLDTGTVSTHIGIAHWVAVLGALLVYFLATKYGRVIPLVGGLTFTLVGMGLLHLSGAPVWFLVGNIIVSTTWAFLIPYLLGMCAEFDADGQMAALCGFCSKMGLATGPLIAAMIVGDGEYTLIINLAFFGIVAGGLILLLPARLLDRKAA